MIKNNYKCMLIAGIAFSSCGQNFVSSGMRNEELKPITISLLSNGNFEDNGRTRKFEREILDRKLELKEGAQYNRLKKFIIEMKEGDTKVSEMIEKLDEDKANEWMTRMLVEALTIYKSESTKLVGKFVENTIIKDEKNFVKSKLRDENLAKSIISNTLLVLEGDLLSFVVNRSLTINEEGDFLSLDLFKNVNEFYDLTKEQNQGLISEACKLFIENKYYDAYELLSIMIRSGKLKNLGKEFVVDIFNNLFNSFVSKYDKKSEDLLQLFLEGEAINCVFIQKAILSTPNLGELDENVQKYFQKVFRSEDACSFNLEILEMLTEIIKNAPSSKKFSVLWGFLRSINGEDLSSILSELLNSVKNIEKNHKNAERKEIFKLSLGLFNNESDRIQSIQQLATKENIGIIHYFLEGNYINLWEKLLDKEKELNNYWNHINVLKNGNLLDKFSLLSDMSSNGTSLYEISLALNQILGADIENSRLQELVERVLGNSTAISVNEFSGTENKFLNILKNYIPKNLELKI